MLFPSLSWKSLAGQNDVQPSLHIPMVYEHVSASPLIWEYHILRIDVQEEALPDEASLNELGEAGWLLINVLEQRVSEKRLHMNYYFVRAKEAEGV